MSSTRSSAGPDGGCRHLGLDGASRRMGGIMSAPDGDGARTQCGARSERERRYVLVELVEVYRPAARLVVREAPGVARASASDHGEPLQSVKRLFDSRP